MLSLPDFKEKTVLICFTREGQKVSFKNDNIMILDHEGKVLMQATCYRVFSVWLIGSVTLSSGILEKSKKFGFSIYLLSYGIRPIGCWASAAEGNFLLRHNQYKYESYEIARHLVCNKMSNQLSLLKSVRRKSLSLQEAIDSLSKYIEQAALTDDLYALLGLEGVASRLFFSEWFFELPWKGRKPRTKVDAINTTLDIGYTYLFHFMECLLQLYGFDVYQGVYHKNFYQRKSLVCDLVEPFRCIIDKQVKHAYNLKQMQVEDFEVSNNRYVLKSEKNKAYTRWIMETILRHKEAMFLYVQGYYRSFIRNKNIDTYPVFSIECS